MIERVVDYRRMDYEQSRHAKRYRLYVMMHGLLCQACDGRGVQGYDSDYGPAEPCGWCEMTGLVTRWIRGAWLRWCRQRKVAA